MSATTPSPEELIQTVELNIADMKQLHETAGRMAKTTQLGAILEDIWGDGLKYVTHYQEQLGELETGSPDWYLAVGRILGAIDALVENPYGGTGQKD